MSGVAAQASSRAVAERLHQLSASRFREQFGVCLLRDGDARVAEELRDDLDPEPSVQQVGGEGTSERVRRDSREVLPRLRAGTSSSVTRRSRAACAGNRSYFPARRDTLDHSPDVRWLHRRAVPCREERAIPSVTAALGEVGVPASQLREQVRDYRDRAQSGVRLAPPNANCALIRPPVDVRQPQGDRFAHANAGPTEERDDDPLIWTRRSSEESKLLVMAEPVVRSLRNARHAEREHRVRQALPGIGLKQIHSREVCEERAERRDLALHRRRARRAPVNGDELQAPSAQVRLDCRGRDGSIRQAFGRRDEQLQYGAVLDDGPRRSSGSLERRKEHIPEGRERRAASK